MKAFSACLDPQLTWEDLFQKQPSVRAGADVARGREGEREGRGQGGE